MLSPYRIPGNSHKRRQKDSNTNLDDNFYREHDLKTSQMTSKEPTNENVISLRSKNRNSLKGGSMHEIDDINDESLDEILHKKIL